MYKQLVNVHFKTTKRLYPILHRNAIFKITDISDSERGSSASESDSDNDETVHYSLEKRRSTRKRLEDYLRKQRETFINL